MTQNYPKVSSVRSVVVFSKNRWIWNATFQRPTTEAPSSAKFVKLSSNLSAHFSITCARATVIKLFSGFLYCRWYILTDGYVFFFLNFQPRSAFTSAQRSAAVRTRLIPAYTTTLNSNAAFRSSSLAICALRNSRSRDVCLPICERCITWLRKSNMCAIFAFLVWGLGSKVVSWTIVRQFTGFKILKCLIISCFWWEVLHSP